MLRKFLVNIYYGKSERNSQNVELLPKSVKILLLSVVSLAIQGLLVQYIWCV